MATKNSYMVHYQRNFCNEYTIYVGTPATLDRVTEILESMPRAENGDTHRITRRRAIQLGVSRVREAKRYSEQWFGGFAETGRRNPETLAEMIADAREATEAVIDEHEAMAEMVAREYV